MEKIHYQLGKIVQAQNDFMRVISNKEYGDIEKVLAYEWLSKILVDQGVSYCSQAIDLVNRALKIGVSYNLIHNKTLALLQLGRYKEAAEVFDQAVLSESHPIINHVNHMAINLLLGRYNAVVEEGEYVVSCQPNNVDALQFLANAYALSGSYDKCIAICNRLPSINANDYLALLFRAASNLYSGEFDLAHSDIAKAGIQSDSDWQLYVTRSAIMLYIDNPREAYFAANKAVSMNNTSPEAYLNRAIATTVLKGWPYAAKDYRRAYIGQDCSDICRRSAAFAVLARRHKIVGFKQREEILRIAKAHGLRNLRYGGIGGKQEGFCSVEPNLINILGDRDGFGVAKQVADIVDGKPHVFRNGAQRQIGVHIV